MRNGFDFCSRQLVNQLGMHIARPRPAANVGDALVVDRNDGNAVRGLARRAGTGKVVIPALQRGKKVGRAVQRQHGQHHQNAHKPVGSPELPALV